MRTFAFPLIGRLPSLTLEDCIRTETAEWEEKQKANAEENYDRLFKTQQEITRMATTEWEEKQKGNAAVNSFRLSSFFPEATCNVVGVPSLLMALIGDDDYSEVYQKLPVGRKSCRTRRHIQWQDVMLLVNNTLEVAFSATKLLPGDYNYHDDLSFDTVMTHVVCARAFSRKHNEWLSGSDERVQLLERNWRDGFNLDEGCKSIAESLARSMGKQELDNVPNAVANLKNMLDSLEQLYDQTCAVERLQAV
jgi:hypothetical protein